MSNHEPVSVQTYQVESVIASINSGQIIAICELSRLISAELVQANEATSANCVVISANCLSESIVKGEKDWWITLISITVKFDVLR
jgi:hypothetical protein